MDKSPRLNSLNLANLDVREIASMFLTRFINKFKSVILEDIMMESHQLEDIFHAILGGDSVLKDLRMCHVKNLSN